MNSKPFYMPFVHLVSGLLVVAVALRLTWELLAPVIVPLVVLGVLAIVARLLWLRTNRF